MRRPLPEKAKALQAEEAHCCDNGSEFPWAQYSLRGVDAAGGGIVRAGSTRRGCSAMLSREQYKFPCNMLLLLLLLLARTEASSDTDWREGPGFIRQTQTLRQTDRGKHFAIISINAACWPTGE